MADVNAKIGVQIDTSAALAELKALQRQLANFHSSVAKGSAASAAAQKNLQYNLLNAINSTGKFYAQMGLVRTSTESFTHALEKNKLSMREYFRYAGGASRTFGRLFKQEFDTIGKVAEERVKKMSTQYIKMGRDASGAMKAMSITPTTLNMKDYGTQVALAAQRQALFNQLLKQGSTNLLNFGKNTQWAGRQLMVGFTIPLAYFGTAASKTFMDLEKQAIKFKRVYGDIFTTAEETDKALADIQQLAQEFTKYGVAVADTMEMASQAAAMGKTGAELTAQVAEATRLAVLGGVEQTQALETTISVTNAFGIAADDLRKKVDFLNAVENQTVVSIEDLTVAIPKAGPVVKQLGGSVEDLAFFLTAMKEGGINASEGANALKSGLASLINPTDKASKMLAEMGINIKGIVEANKGDIKRTVIGFAQALDTLNPLQRARAVEQLFGKFQFARLSTLFQNVTKDGTQASRVLQLASASVEELAILSERELKKVEDAVGVNFREAVEKLKVSIAPIGKVFLETVTPIVKVLGKLFDKFDSLSSGTKKFIVVVGTFIAGVGPILLMTIGLIANAVANIIKLFTTMRGGFLRASTTSKILAEQTQYLNSEQLEAATVAASLNQAHNRLTQSFQAETIAIQMLRQAYIDATGAAARFSAVNPGMMNPGFRGFGPKKFASGTTGVVGGTPGKDSVPSLLMPGEAVVPTKIAQDDNFKPLVEALVTGKIAKYGDGTTNVRWGDNEYNARTAKSSKSVKLFLDGLVKNSNGTYTYMDPKDPKLTKTFTQERLSTVLNKYSDRGDLTLDKIKRGLELGKSYQNRGAGGSSAPTWIKDLKDRAKYPNILAEKDAIVSSLEKQGIKLSQGKLNNLFQTQASHIVPDIDANGKKIWRAANIVPDSGWVNNYLNRVKGDLGKTLSSFSDNSLKQLGIDRKELSKLMNDNHPITGKAAGTLSNIAKYDILQNPNHPKIYQAHAVVAGMKYRGAANFYPNSGSIKNLAQIFPKNKKVVEEIAVAKGEVFKTKDGKIGVVTGQTGRPKPSGVNVTKNPRDTRIMSASNLARVFPYGVKGPRFAGAIDGYPDETTSMAGGKRFSQTASGLLVPQSALVNALEKNKEAVEGSSKQQEESNKTNKQSAKEAKGIRMQQRVTGVAGPAAMALGTIGMVSAMSGAPEIITKVTFGLSALAGVLPLLMNPVGAVIGALALMGATIYKFNSDIKKAREEGIALAKSMSMTNEKTIELSKLSGTVSATELAKRKRETFVSGSGEGQRQFGQNILASEFGKQILSDIEKQKKSGMTSQQIAQSLATNLSEAVVQGSITTKQAKSIAMALGEKLGSYEIPALISGRITTLLGPNGENLAIEPLQVALSIKKESLQQQSEAFQTALNQRKPLTTAAGTTQIGVGASLMAIGGSVATTGVGAPIGGAIALAGAAVTLAELKEQNDRKANNVKLDTAALQLGIEAAAQNQRLIDSLNRQYDVKIKQAKTTEEINRLETERKNALVTVNRENAKTLDILIQQKDQLSPGAWTAAIKAAADALYKEGPMKVFKDEALTAIETINNKDFKATLQLGLATGDIDPLTLTTITKLINEKPDLAVDLSLIVDREGMASLGVISQLMTKTGADANTIDVMLNYINNNATDFTKDLEALRVLSSFKQTYDVTLDLKTNGMVQLSTATKALDIVKDIPDDLTKTIVQDLAIKDPATWSKFLADWDYLTKDPKTGKQNDTVNKYLYVNYMVGTQDPNLQSAALVAGLTVPELIAKSFTPETFKPGDAETPGDTGKRDTTFDDILINLKRTRDATIDVTKGAKELMRVLGGTKDITIFSGLDQQLARLGANTDFLDFVGGVEKAIQNRLVVVNKKGIASLTELGKAAMKAYNEKQLGLYQAEQVNAIQGAIAQREAFVKLKAVGASSAEALDLVADKQLAIAINSQRSTKELKDFLKTLREAKAEALKTGEVIDPLGSFDEQMDKAFKVFDLRERQARAKYRTEIDKLNKLIDSAEGKVQILQRKSEIEYGRPIEVLQNESRQLNNDLSIISQATEKINEKYDKQREALESVYKINERIAQQQKSRITLADALTQGDISAAAQAAQDIRNQSQEYAQQDSLDSLEKAKQNEIDSLRSASGLTRVQIEQRLYEISQEIYNIETKRQAVDAEILKLQDEIYNLKEVQLKATEDALQAELDAIDAQRQKWEDTRLSLEGAKAEADGYNDMLLEAEATLKRMLELWKQMGAKMFSGGGSGGVLGGGTGETSAAAAFGYTDAAAYRDYRAGERMYGGLIRKYDVGGIVAGSGMTDKVPALLTPGEYVVNKAATQKFGPLLEQLNESKYPGSLSLSGSPMVAGVSNNMINNNSTSVYNYSLTVDVAGSSANPDDIARTVIAQIRNMDAQRLRGNKY